MRLGDKILFGHPAFSDFKSPVLSSPSPQHGSFPVFNLIKEEVKDF